MRGFGELRASLTTEVEVEVGKPKMSSLALDSISILYKTRLYSFLITIFLILIGQLTT